MNRFTSILETAYNLRKFIIDRDGLKAYRLYDRENDKLTEVAIDIYGDFAEIQIYAPMPDQKIFDTVEVLFKDLKFKGVYVKDRTKDGLNNLKSGFLHGEKHPAKFVFEEPGYKYLVNLEDYLDTGVFLDAREIRRIVKKMSNKKRVLNLFSYTATATLAAIVGGARETVSVDISKNYTEWARKNFELNDVDTAKHKLVVSDVMTFINSEKGKREKYDLIIVDPPTFSHSKSGDFSVDRDHLRLINDCLFALNQGGQIIFSTHLRDFRLAKNKIKAKIVEITDNTVPFDFSKGGIHKSFKIFPSSKWDKMQERIAYSTRKKEFSKDYHKRKRGFRD